MPKIKQPLYGIAFDSLTRIAVWLVAVIVAATGTFGWDMYTDVKKLLVLSTQEQAINRTQDGILARHETALQSYTSRLRDVEIRLGSTRNKD